MKQRSFTFLTGMFVASIATGFAQVLDFDPTSEGPWSDIAKTTLTVPLVPKGSVVIDGTPSAAEYGNFPAVEVTPGKNAWILDFPGDRAWKNAADSSFTYWLAHDEEYFYVGVSAKDDVVFQNDPNRQLWKDDSIEIVVDALNDRYDVNTDQSNDEYGGHCYVSYNGKFSMWDDDAKSKGGELWSSAVDWKYGKGEGVWAVGKQVAGGWTLEVAFKKSLFESSAAKNKLSNGYKMGFNIGMDDDDKKGPGGDGERSQDLELQYWWANRARLKGWNADAAAGYTAAQIAAKAHEKDFDKGVDSAGRLSHGGTGEIVFAANNPYATGGTGGTGGTATTVVAGPKLDDTRTQSAYTMEAAPVIDGTVDADEWKFSGGGKNYWRVFPDDKGFAADGIRGGELTNGKLPADEGDLSYIVQTAFDKDYLYVAVQVTDNDVKTDTAAKDSKNGETWQDDSVEVFVDGLNKNDAKWAKGQAGGQFVISANNAYREAEAGDPGYGPNAAWYAKTALTDDGYSAEFRIAWRVLGNPKAGDAVGFTVVVNDDDGGGTADRQISWKGKPHEPVTYGNLVLGGQAYTAIKTSKAPNPDGKIAADEYAGAMEIFVTPKRGVVYIAGADDDLPVTDLTYRVYSTHDANNVYVAFDVIDEKISTDQSETQGPDLPSWEDDSVEVFFDVDNSKDFGGGTGKDDGVFEGQYAQTPKGTYFDGSPSKDAIKGQHWFAGASTTAKGYQIEFRIPKKTLGNPKDDASMGFHVTINDDDQVGNGEYSHIGWTGQAHHEYTYGTITFSSKSSLDTGGGTPGTPKLLTPLDFGQSVDGFQDDFTGATRNAAWIAAPEDKDEYKQGNGVLKVTVVGEGAFDTHLLYKGNYSDNAQEVLARIRVTNFGKGDPARCGIAVGVDPDTSQGINLHFRDHAQDGLSGRQFKLLDDRRAWGPRGLDIKWLDNTWYWVRLKQTSDTADQGENILGKVWLGDGTVAEPADWQMKWTREGRVGLAGLVGSSIGGISEYEVDYILIKAAGLPKITPAASAFGGTVTPPPTGGDARPNLISQTRYAGGAFGITLQSKAGVKYDLEYSQDLKTWTVINPDVAGTGQPIPANETDATRKARKVGFYRVKQK